MTNNEVKEKKNSKIKYIIVFGIIIIFVISLFCKSKNTDIKHVNKILPQKYYMISCLDSNCDGIVAYKGSKLGKSKITLLNNKGDIVAKYKDVYDAKEKTVKEPISLGKNFFIYKKVNSNTGNIVGYSIGNKKGKEVYSTENYLKVLTNNLVLMNETNKGLDSYSLLNSKGNIIIKNINNLDMYANNTIISLEKDGEKEILDEKGNLILSNYYVAKEFLDENGKTDFLLVEDSKNNSYNYFSIKDLKIVGDSFQNYTKNTDGTLTITKKENNNTVKYILYKDGKQKLIKNSMTQSEMANELKKKIDSKKYNIYTLSINSESQKYVFVDELSSKAFGIYDIKNNKFIKIFDYKQGTSSVYSSVSKINNDNSNYYQISCSTYSCDKNEFYVYDLSKAKVLYKMVDESLKIQNYYQYNKDYKVIKYSYSSSNDKYQGKYVLYDKNNKEIIISNNMITVIDEKLLIGSDLGTSSLIIYSSKDNKVLNNDASLASRITIEDKVYYKYQKDSKNIIVNDKAKEILNIDSKIDLIYSDKSIVYISGNKINIIDGSTGKTKKYKLRKNEKLNDASGDLIPPYNGALFINNSVNNKVKIINSKGKIIKKIKKSEIQSVYKTKDNNVLIITKNDSSNIPKYGLYLAK